MSTLPHALVGLVDDAAVFPPGNAHMTEAVAAYRSRASSPHAQLVGKFLCPASRLAEMRAALEPGDEMPVGVIADTGREGLPEAVAVVRTDPRLNLGGVEIAAPADEDSTAAVEKTLAVLPTVIPSYIELPRTAGWRSALDLIAAAARGAKLRTGGLSAEMFPTEAEVADFIRCCVEGSVPFKCTAGLHRAVRHTDPVTGFEHHGFLNIALATAAAVRGEACVVDLVAERDPAVVASGIAAFDHVTAGAVRAHFVAFGSCSIDEPVEDLEKLGLL